ncbi:MAG: hypothetical protein K9M84_11580, partial [Spirochaetia bacterium]|nr:hypothetical protein [Spirochaetia bacterium]
LLIPVLWDQQSLEMNLREADHPLRLKDTVWIRSKYSAVWSCYTDSGYCLPSNYLTGLKPPVVGFYELSVGICVKCQLRLEFFTTKRFQVLL